MITLYEFIVDSISILWSGEKNIDKIWTYFTYLRIFIKSHIVKIFKIKITSEKIYGYKLHFNSYNNFIALFREIFIHKRYFFPCLHDSPKIIDCGGHIGGSVIFFKRLYPKSNILVFEPNLCSFNLLDKNVRSNRLENVSIINSAVANEDGSVIFYIDPNDSCSQISSKHKTSLISWGKTINEIVVTSVRLSSYITSEIDLLKIDIEGSELEVLEEISPKLKFIKRIIIEYHYYPQDVESNKLSRILEILDVQNFKYVITSSIREDLVRFNLDKPYTLHIYAYRNS